MLTCNACSIGGTRVESGAVSVARWSPFPSSDVFTLEPQIFGSASGQYGINVVPRHSSGIKRRILHAVTKRDMSALVVAVASAGSHYIRGAVQLSRTQDHVGHLC